MLSAGAGRLGHKDLAVICGSGYWLRVTGYELQSNNL